jgi:predicted ester cyclase
MAETILERNTNFVICHFDEFVNKRDLTAIDRNVAEDFFDHDGPGGKPADRAVDRAMMARMHETFPDLRVQVLDHVAQGDRVVVRNLWTGINATTGKRVEFHGFVMWRIAGDKIAERWATVTPMHEISAAGFEW